MHGGHENNILTHGKEERYVVHEENVDREGHGVMQLSDFFWDLHNVESTDS